MKITLDEDGKGMIPPRVGRESFSMTLLSGTACWAHEPDVTEDGDTQGQPMTIGETIHFIAPGGGNRVFARALYFAGSAGAEIIYTQTPPARPEPEPEPEPEEEEEEEEEEEDNEGGEGPPEED